MKWEIYNKLTEGEKEEYDYKFSNCFSFHRTNGVGKVLGIIYIIMWLIFIGMNTTLLLLGDLSSVDIGEYLRSSMIVLTSISKFFFMFISLMLIIDWIVSFVNLTKRNKWLDEKLDVEYKVEVKRK